MAFEVNEKTSSRLTGIFKDETGAVVGSSGMVSIAATLTDKVTGAVINSRSSQDVLNANGGTLDADGNFVLTFAPGDHEIQNQALDYEVHVLLLDWVFASGAKGGTEEQDIYVHNLSNVT